MTDPLKAEILAVAASSPDGLLRPSALVEYAASNPESELHNHFKWNDAEAAAEYRIQQARQLIRLVIKFEPRVNRIVRGFVSVATDRINDGGYRTVESALDNPLLRGQLVEQALNDLAGVRGRYKHLPEMDAVFDAVDSLVLQSRERKGAQAA